ncbi:hypothetical protein VMCG_05727 [Cytospora schulzeri]|uniref:Cytochrome P450 n=1 Tax=Cytospora schulzeri TaxID=448051 RepID=A0A423WI49_9PEZI|nr:hypothetical protein VMCG_05727 [Valsa malicola]
METTILPPMPVLPLLLLMPLVFVTYHFIVYPALLSPASKIPNAHWSAAVSPLWILHKRFRKRENAALQQAHRRLGPYIRIAPGEVSVDDVEGSSPAMAAQAEVIIYDRFLPVLERCLPVGGVDVYSLFLATVMDFISAYIWGISRSTNFIDNQGYREHWLELYKARNDFGFFPQELPRLTAMCRSIGLHLYPSWVDAANKELAAWNTDLCERTMKHLAAGQDISRDTADDPVVMRALLNGIRKEEETHGENSPLYTTTIRQKDLSVQSELWDHVLAGQETAGLALTYLTWHMSQHPDLQAKLREEITLNLGGGRSFSLSPAGGPHPVLPDPKGLDALPLLHAIVMETLRLHAPIPGPQPREVPRRGARVGPYGEVPGGVRIAALAYTLHRDERVFPDAERWEPYRWLEGEGEEMKLIAAAVYSNYTTHILDDRGIEQGDGYTGRPASEQLWVRFERVA